MAAIASISNGESGSSVRTKLNSAITLANENNMADLRYAMLDANLGYGAGIREVYLSEVLTAPRVLTLPPASNFPAGTEIIFIDEIGGVTSTNTISITRDGADTINGSATAFTLYSPNVVFKLITDGVSAWTGGVFSNNSDGVYTAWVPTFTGFSVVPSSVTARYLVQGKSCTCYLASSAGTSNATTFTITLPFNAKNGSQYFANIMVTNNGVATTTPGLLVTRASSNIADLYLNTSAAAWTASASKNARFVITYETE